jgi:hypothetical protein
MTIATINYRLVVCFIIPIILNYYSSASPSSLRDAAAHFTADVQGAVGTATGGTLAGGLIEGDRSPAVSAADVWRGFFVRATDLAASQPVENSALPFLSRRIALAAQSFQLPFKILQFRDSRPDMRDVLIKQAVSLVAILPGNVPNTQ